MILKDMNTKRMRTVYILSFFSIFLIEVCIARFVHDHIIRPYVGDMLVTVLICTFVRIFYPKGWNLLSLSVFIFSVFIEILQYYDIIQLLGLSHIHWLSVLFGRTFSVLDIICYGLGCFIFHIIERMWLHKKNCIFDKKDREGY